MVATELDVDFMFVGVVVVVVVVECFVGSRESDSYSGRRRLRFLHRYRRKSLVDDITVRCTYETDCVMEYDNGHPVGKTFSLSCYHGGAWWPLNGQARVLNAAKFNMYRHKKLLRSTFSFSNCRMYMETGRSQRRGGQYF